VTIEGRTWRRLGHFFAVVAVLPAANLFLAPDLGPATELLAVVSEGLLISIAGLGAVVGFLQRRGIVQFHYCDDDVRTLGYRLAKRVAEMEQGRGFRYSSRYYESYGLLPPQQGCQDGGAGAGRPRRGLPEEWVKAAAIVLSVMGWLMLVISGVMSVIGFLYLAHPQWKVTVNGVETTAIGERLLVALIPLVPAAIAAAIIWVGPRVLRWFLSHVPYPSAVRPPGGTRGKAGGK
jgi:hypothetical protein